MAALPSSLTKHSRQWNLAVALLVISYLSGMVAAFMPMKAILVLASDSVPSFFPRFLVEGGAVLTALALVILAIASSLVAWLTNRAVTGLDDRSERASLLENGSVTWDKEQELKASKARVHSASLLLTVPISVVLAIFSIPYLLLTALWITASAAWVAIGVRRSARNSLYESGWDQFSHGLAEWLKRSALWSVVAIALVTFLVAPPALGSTAILVSAIFGRRLTLAIADVLPESITTGVAAAVRRSPERVSKYVKNDPRGQVRQRPIEFLTSAVGRQQLERELRRMGIGPYDWEIVAPESSPTSLVSSRPDGNQMLIRIFPANAQSERDREYRLRESNQQRLFQPSTSIQAQAFAGFPSIILNLSSASNQFDANAKVSHEIVARFQLQHEIESEAPDLRHPTWLQLNRDEFTDRLLRMSRIPGDHAMQCLVLAERVSEIVGHLSCLSATRVPSSVLKPADFYLAKDGTANLLNGSGWRRGHMGDQWGPKATFEATLRQILDELEKSATTPFNCILLNAEVHDLDRAMHGFQMGLISTNLEHVLQRLDLLSLN